jgi:hypothetical protein
LSSLRIVFKKTNLRFFGFIVQSRNLTESPIKKDFALVILTQAMLGFALASVFAQSATTGQTTTPALVPEATPAPTFGDKATQVLPDRNAITALFGS